MSEPLLDVRDLQKHYPITEGILKRQVGTVRAVDGISFALERGETLGLVGESGCGKSTAATTILQLEAATAGAVYFDGEDVTGLEGRELKRFRRRTGMIFQDPTSSFDPRMTVGESITEPLRIHGVTDRDHRREVGEDLLERVGLAAPDYDRYPHAFSGGQRQRIAIARALVVNPELVVADEPVSALDVSIQSEILSLLADLQEEFGIALLFISHDLGVIREVCDRVAVMYLGEIVEIGPTERVFEDPQHPYTEALLSAIPEPDPDSDREVIKLSGSVPSASDPPDGCRFHTRCPAVVQPAGIDLDQEVWRRILDARQRIAEGSIDVETAIELYAEDRDVEVDDLDDEDALAALRVEFDLPERIGDASVEGAMTDALAALLDDDPGRALDRLADVTRTPCEEYEPTLRGVGEKHEVACHLRHPPEGVDVDGDPVEADGRATDGGERSEPGGG